MTKEHTLHKIQTILSWKWQDYQPTAFLPDTNLCNWKYCIDSLDLMEIMFNITNEFQISFWGPEEDLFYARFKQSPTVKTLVDVVYEKKTTGRLKPNMNELSSKLANIIKRQK